MTIYEIRTARPFRASDDNGQLQRHCDYVCTAVPATSRAVAIAIAIARHRQIHGLGRRTALFVDSVTEIRPQLGMTYDEFLRHANV